MNPIRVLLADDHALVRAGIRSLLQSVKEIEVIAETGDGWEALQIVEQDTPDVVLMDIAMPRLNGLEATVRITRDFPDVRVIILSMHATEEYVLQALRNGAAGYILKDSALSELEMAVKTVMKGKTYVSSSVSKHVTDYTRRAGNALTPFEQLTPRQREILQLIAEGYSTKEIAHKLNISVKTADTHRTQLMNRLDIHDVASLVRYAIRLGLIVPDQ